MTMKTIVLYSIFAISLNFNIAKDRFLLLPFLPRIEQAELKKAG